MKKEIVAYGQQLMAKCKDAFRTLSIAISHKLPSTNFSRGFTLIELMVSVTLFIVVMMVSVGALLSLVNANRKARALESVVNNLNITLDGMVRSIRMGSNYTCGNGALPGADGADCAGGDTWISFTPFGKDPSDVTERVNYRYNATYDSIQKRVGGGTSSFVDITAPEVNIDSLTFYVVGTATENLNTVQPKVVIVAKGTAGEGKNSTEFFIQATAVQRVLDI